VRQIELYHNAGGKVYCLLDGPDEEAIRQHHAALGVPGGDVHQWTASADRAARVVIRPGHVDETHDAGFEDAVLAAGGPGCGERGGKVGVLAEEAGRAVRAAQEVEARCVPQPGEPSAVLLPASAQRYE
jgi:hypothetical protein